jgi:8-oxo-dGTP diphosphatase
MSIVFSGLRDGALTLTYNLFLVARDVQRMLLRPIELGVRVLVPLDERVLLVRHRGGAMPWALPGGGLEPDESLVEAALREVVEESGCPSEPRALHGIFHSFNGGLSNHITVFVCTPLGMARPPVGNLEIADARFFLTRDLPANLEPGSRRRITEYLAGEQGLYRPW